MRTTPFVAALAFLPGLALAQDDPAGLTCAKFLALPVDEQVVALSTLQPFGDEMNATDLAASQDWATDVSRACDGHPDRLLPEAAQAAMGD